MTKRYRNHDTEDVPVSQDTALLGIVPPDHIMSGRDNESFEETETHHPLAELLEHLWQFQEQLTYFEPATHPTAHIAELTQLTDKLQHLTMTLQLYLTPPG